MFKETVPRHFQHIFLFKKKLNPHSQRDYTDIDGKFWRPLTDVIGKNLPKKVLGCDNNNAKPWTIVGPQALN